MSCQEFIELEKIIKSAFPESSLDRESDIDETNKYAKKLLNNLDVFPNMFPSSVENYFMPENGEDNLDYLLNEFEIDSKCLGIVLIDKIWYFHTWGLSNGKIIETFRFNCDCCKIDLYWPGLVTKRTKELDLGTYQDLTIFDKEDADEKELIFLNDLENRQTMEAICFIYDKISGVKYFVESKGENHSALHEKVINGLNALNLPLCAKRFSKKAHKSNEFSSFTSYIYPQKGDDMETELIMIYIQSSLFHKKSNNLVLLRFAFEIFFNYISLDIFRNHSFMTYPFNNPVFMEQRIIRGKSYYVPKLVESEAPIFILSIINKLLKNSGKAFKTSFIANLDKDFIKSKYYSDAFYKKTLTNRLNM